MIRPGDIARTSRTCSSFDCAGWSTNNNNPDGPRLFMPTNGRRSFVAKGQAGLVLAVVPGNVSGPWSFVMLLTYDGCNACWFDAENLEKVYV